jgi:ABC-2 type transport system ATP-binding protein
MGADPGPVVVDAADVGVRTHRGWVYSGFGLRAHGGQLVAIAGAGGSGRTSVLLTLGGRMRPSQGSLRVCGYTLPGAAAKVRALTAVARIGGVAELEPELRIADHVRERALTGRARAADFGAARDVVRADLAAGRRVASLAPWELTALALALALMESRPIIVLDDLDTGADTEAQTWLWRAGRRVAETGTCVIATTTESGPADGIADQVVGLDRALDRVMS